MERNAVVSDVEAAAGAAGLAEGAGTGSASAFGLPHPLSRPGQRETVDWLLGLPQGAAAVVSAPTGSGKTAFAAALGYGDRRAVALVKTKSLQVENYGLSYRFDVMYGRANYECENPDALEGASANDCLFPRAMAECPQADACTYLAARRRAQSSRRASLNYAYWLTAGWPGRELAETVLDKKRPAYLVMDEAHQLSDITLEWASCTVAMKDRLTWELPAFPVLHGHARPQDVEVAHDWLDQAMDAVDDVIGPLAAKRQRYADDKRPEDLLTSVEQKTLNTGERLFHKLENVFTAMVLHDGDWYIRSGPGTIENGGAPQPGFVARPLTARHHFGKYFLGPWTSVMMSATIGNPQTFAEELGLPADFHYRDIPNQFAPALRPVYALPAPAMGQKTRGDEKVEGEQARVIADAIQACPREWGGIVHVTRKAEAVALAARLERHGLGGRLWTPGPHDSTDWQLKRWKEFKRWTRGAIAITWAWWEGYDGLEEKICIVAKTPFPNLADDYERARMSYSGTMFLQRTAWNLEQALGRTRRGHADDYDGDGERRGLVAIADGNWTRARGYMSPSVREAIVEGAVQ